MKNKRLAVIAAGAIVATAASSQAATFDFSGDIAYQKDVVRISFTLLADATNVKVWTDGFMGGLNFDPITAVWSMPTGAVVGQNDDDPSIAPGQTYFDSGLVFPTLAAGDYLFTIAAYPNFAVSSSLADGFVYDHETPIPIPDWCQPASHACTNQKGTYWSVHLSGVDVAAVPEPGTYALMLGGLAVVGCVARRRALPQVH